MAAKADKTVCHANWSGELQDLQDETIRLLRTIRSSAGSRQEQQARRHTAPRKDRLHRESGDGSATRTACPKARRARKRRRRARTNRNAALGRDNFAFEAGGPDAHLCALRAEWPGGQRISFVEPSHMGSGKTTVEVLDKGEETPRFLRQSDCSEGLKVHTNGDNPNGGGRRECISTPRKFSQVAVTSVAGDEEGRIRCLAFEQEERRVRDRTDTFMSGGGSLSDDLRRLTDERTRLARIEQAQREASRGVKEQEFLRFGRRKWLKSESAAEAIQRLFRGRIGRKRAELAYEVKRLTGEARAEWIEVRDQHRGEAWYFNPLTGQSQWDRPESLMGTITTSQKVKILPALGPSSPFQDYSPSRRGQVMEASGGNTTRSVYEKCIGDTTHGKQSPRSFCRLDDFAAEENDTGSLPAFTTRRGGRALTASSLPLLMRGSRHSVLLPTPPWRKLSSSADPRGERSMDEGRKRVDQQHAWVNTDEEVKGCEERERARQQEQFPFAARDDVLPDDRFEDTGLGLARRSEEAGGLVSAGDSDDLHDGTRGFFLADGTPNIHLRRTIATALRVTKFDSVSTLLADYAARCGSSIPNATEGSRTTARGGKADSNFSSTTSDGNRPRPSKEREREHNSNGPGHDWKIDEARTVDRNMIYPGGKLEEDENTRLFSSARTAGGRKMVSVMTLGGILGRAGEGQQRSKTAGVREVPAGGSYVNGLSIRDLTRPGFLPQQVKADQRSEDKAVGGGSGGVANGPVSDTRDSLGQDGTRKAGVEATRESIDGGVRAINAVSITHEVCFNCWSKGSGKTCTLHAGGRADSRGNEGDGKSVAAARPAESALMCKNWDVGVMRRRYRSEELQEIFLKEASSLKYDKERKKFVSVVEQKHPIYRLVASIIARYNFTARRKVHQRNWMRGFAEQTRAADKNVAVQIYSGEYEVDVSESEVDATVAVKRSLMRMGKLAGASPDKTAKTSRILRLRNTLQNLAQVTEFTMRVKTTQPQPPITGTTFAERLGLVRVLVHRPSEVMGRTTKVVLDGPTPVPQALYEARRFVLPPRKTMPMPEPKYLENEDGGEGEGRVFGDTGRQRVVWMPLMCRTTVWDIVQSAVSTVEVMSPVPGQNEKARTKHPPALTIKFATFSRKPTPGMLARGGLPAEMVVHMLVSTRMPPQYGNFTVMQKSSVAPTVSAEQSAEYFSLELLVANQAFVSRGLQHPLNNRTAPTITLKTLMADPANKHYFGANRPDQTGEAGFHGFRTSSHAVAAPALPTLDPTVFKPSEDVATPNLCSANRTVTTHADRSYPFCEPSNRSNTTLDFYHLLLTATCSPNKEQVFTNLGVQECGEFMRGNDPLLPMGHCIGVVYRSWAFIQSQVMEEFETDDDVPYWFDRRTGETFWERPLCKEEKVPVKEGGTTLGGTSEPPDSSGGIFEDIKPRYDQQQMRKLMMKSHEGTEALERRRKQAATQVKWARNSGALPPPNPDDFEPFKNDHHHDDEKNLHDPKAEPQSCLDDADGVQISTSRSQPSPNGQTDPPSESSLPEGRARQGREVCLSSSPRGRWEGGRRLRRLGDGGSEGFDDATAERGDSKANRFAESVAQALTHAGLPQGQSLRSADMLRLGMGLGITLGANGWLKGDEDHTGGDEDEAARRWPKRSSAKYGLGKSGTVEMSLAPPVIKMSPNDHPIGHGHAAPNAAKEDSCVLDHESAAEHLASIAKDSAELRTSEEFKGLLVVPPAQPTPSPDEVYGLARPQDTEADPRRKAALQNPVIAYPETLWKKRYRGHAAAGEGDSWLPAGADRVANQRAKSSLGATMRRTNEPLPEGFLNAISHTHVGKQHCDYLPHVPNMPQARAVGRVRPRSAAEDWFAVGFDPWSAGREPLSAEFVPTLSIKQEDLATHDDGERTSTVPQSGYLELQDSSGQAEMAIVSAEEAKLATDFEKISSWARHARYADVENAMNQADWTMTIDYQNDLGITLLHVAAQNGNKRIAKLCLRKGADVNRRNHNGQTPLHYAYSYGFESFGEYLISKGADDSIVNADGLTCYEGLNQDNLGQL